MAVNYLDVFRIGPVPTEADAILIIDSKPMYSLKERLRAVELYIKYDKCATDVIRELGYPASRKSVYAWHEEYRQELETGAYADPHERMKRYAVEQKRAAVDHYLEHGRSLSRTIKAMGYPSKQVLTEWIDELAPGMRKTNNSLQCSYEQKKAAVVDLCARKKSAKEVAFEHGVDRDTLYQWKKNLLGKEACMAGDKIPDELPDDIDELKSIAASLQDDICRLKLEVDILEGTAELLKKDGCVDPASPTNEGKYGYRPIHAALRQEDKAVSEKVVRGIMAEEHLAVRRKKTKTYSSYAGEASPAPDNIVARDFRADNPNEKWLTDITEFAIPAGKVYLSPIVDCFDGMAVSWTIGTSPNADMANSMLRNAISTLTNGEKPLVHSDRGGHYRWPGWIRIMDEAGLTRSMSKKGCSPDNSVNESLNGWVKEELFCDFHLGEARTGNEVARIIDEYVQWFNSERPCWSLDYMTPDGFYEAYLRDEMEHRDTFKNRVLDDTPKFVRDKLAKAEEAADANINGIGTSADL